ncbi:MAG: hypothetical protein IJK23_12135 [Clostridia bacterium]|nr:hypothetical protein [Clostridia bacterium]
MARAVYDSLTAQEQEQVDNYAVLTSAEERYAELEAAAQTTDPPTDPEDPEDDGHCRWCGQTHTGPCGKIVGMFHKVLYFFACLFGKE